MYKVCIEGFYSHETFIIVRKPCNIQRNSTWFLRLFLLSEAHSTFSLLRRNQNYLDILRLLSLGDKQLSSFDISLRFTHLFWLGDLNYRLDMDIQVGDTGRAQTKAWIQPHLFTDPVCFVFTLQEILNYINRKEFEPLLKVDQLNLEREKNKVFLRFGQ